MLPFRSAIAVAALALALEACTAGGALDGTGRRSDESVGRSDAGTRDRVTLGPLVRVLPPDSIPPIDDPDFVPIAEADIWLEDREPIIALEIAGTARAYPVQVMTWHEIVNDQVAATPVTVTYCPLCNSAVAFEREVDGRVLDFGTSGRLYQSALVMYDRQTESLWTHFTGEAIQGELLGMTLEVIPVQMLSFGEWRALHPDGLVLSRNTGHERPYGENPYPGYDQRGPYGGYFNGDADARLRAIARVVGVEHAGRAVAYPYASLSSGGSAGVVHDSVGGREVVVFWKAGVASALDTAAIYRGRDVGSSGVFAPRLDDGRLSFEAGGGRIIDHETRSEWSLSGRAVSGPLAGEQLRPIPHLDTFWFAWEAYHPETSVHRRTP